LVVLRDDAHSAANDKSGSKKIAGIRGFARISGHEGHKRLEIGLGAHEKSSLPALAKRRKVGVCQPSHRLWRVVQRWLR
jgi:hypothetical protein